MTDNKEKLCIRVAEFEDKIIERWNQLEVENDFCDVTLVCRE